MDSIRYTKRERFDEERVWQLEDVVDAAREVPLEHQPDRLRAALATLVLSSAPTRPARPPAQS
jgi:hypothetical protein